MKKTISYLFKLFLAFKSIHSQTKEIEWAHIFRDSIRGKKHIENLPINVGRWAGNYSFFYILNRILNDFKPTRILDLGLGESSKFISTYIENYIPDSVHTIVEHDINWIDAFHKNFQLSARSNIIHCELTEKIISNHKVYGYNDFDKLIIGTYDLYIIDGPFGSERFSRHDIIQSVKQFSSGSEFIIIMDDSERKGERDTINEILKILKLKGIKYYIGEYSGNKNNSVIATERYKYASSL